MTTPEISWRPLEHSEFNYSSFSGLWLLAAATYGVGDIVTTITIIWFTPQYTEANLIVQEVARAFGVSGFVGLKLLVFLVSLGICLWGGLRNDDSLLFYGPPVLLTVVGLLVTTSNLVLLFG